MRISQHLSLSQTTVEQLQNLQDQNNLKSRSATIDYLINFYFNNVDTIKALNETLTQNNQALTLQRKYINEIRKNEFLIINMLNSFAISLDVKYSPSHLADDFKSQAYLDALHHYKKYMAEIQVKIKGNDTTLDEEKSDN